MIEKSARHLLYLDTRDLPAERDGELLAAVVSGFPLVVATDHPEKYRYHQIDHLIETALGKYDVAEPEIARFLGLHGIQLAGILCWKDREVELACRLAARFQLRGHNAEAARRVRDKAEMRKAISHLDANPKFAVVSNRAEFEASLGSMRRPCLLKPAGNSGSRGIVRVSEGNHDFYGDFFRYNSGAGGDMFSYYADHALLEEELSGSEHSVAGLVDQGRIYVMAITDKRFQREIFMQYENVIPSQLPLKVQTAIVDLINNALTSIKLSYGGFHADIIVDSEGKPYILEIGGRLGGEMINSHLIPLAYGGYSPYDQLIRIMTDRGPSLIEKMYLYPSMKAGARIIRAPHVGTIGQVHGVDELSRHPAVRLVMQMKGPGSTLYLPREKFKHYEVIYIIAQCRLEENMSELLDSLETSVQIEMNRETLTAEVPKE